MSFDSIRIYAPVLMGTAAISRFAEANPNHTPSNIERFINRVGGGMVSGLAHSYLLHGADVLKAAKAQQLPTQTTIQAVKSFVGKVGPEAAFHTPLRNLHVNMFAKGATAGLGLFVVDQAIKAYKEHDS